MYSHRDKDRFAPAFVLISTAPFAIAIVAAFLTAF